MELFTLTFILGSILGILVGLLLVSIADYIKYLIKNN